MKYLVTTPWWLRMFYPGCLWEMPSNGNNVYLSFDDGPHEKATPFVLDILKEYDAKASFFCIGKNVAAHPVIYERIISEGHAIGNHTYHHLNGWKTKNEVYYDDILAAAALISSHYFRPPYGQIRFSQVRHLKEHLKFRPVMWSVLSGDFDKNITREKCAQNVIDNMRPGSIVVYHDSAKALDKITYALPKVLDNIRKRGWVTEKL
jgi:peptidoglycan/xylan/chitin deacetylase (PgdA/CDA1 family)